MKTNAGFPALACNLSVFTPEQRHEHEENCSRLFHQASQIQVLSKGLMLELPNERTTLSLASDFVSGESQCCPFLDFDIHLEPPYAHVELSITGPQGSREFLKEEFAELLR